MQQEYQNIEFEGISYVGDTFTEDDFDYCTFSNCDFTNVIFSSCKFHECIFVDCNLSMTQFPQSTLSELLFKSSKVLGVNFGQCNDFIFEVHFENCTLDYSSFEKRKMIKARIIKSSLKGVDFAHADLKESNFSDSDFTEAMFYHTNLQKANFVTATNYIIDPDENNIKKAAFSRDGLAGLLLKHNIIIK